MVKVPKILFVHGIGAIGGSERELVTIVSQFAQRGYHPVVVCPVPSPLQQELASCGVETRNAPFPAWRKLKTFFTRGKSVRFLESIIQSIQPQLIHVNDMWWVPQTRRACQKPGGPVVAHVRQNIDLSKVIPYELNQIDAVCAVSRKIQDSLEAGGVSPGRVRTLYSGLELKGFSLKANGHEIRRKLGLSHDDVVLGTVANLFPIKGYDVMLRAMPMIVARVPRTHYLIIGSGGNTYESQLRHQIEQLHLEKHIHFLGFQPNVVPYLAAMDVYIQPSRMEGLGIAVIEAMAMKKPVVSTDVGGQSEIVQHQRTGLIVNHEDVQALAQAVLDLLLDPERCRVFGEQGRQSVEAQFTVTAMMDGLIDIYRHVLQPQ